MKTIHKIFTIIPGFTASMLIFILSPLSSCKKLVEVPAPSNTLVTATVFNSDITTLSAQLSVYTAMQGTGGVSPYNLEFLSGLSSDELINYSTSASKINTYKNILNAAADGSGILPWSTAYKAIYQENAILESIGNSPKISANIKQITTGEAKFVRAYLYFQLVNLYGDVPLVLSTDYVKNGTLPRTPKAQVYQQIITDLKDAQSLLPNDYIDGSDNPGSTDRVRPTTWAADALLARVYLYYGNLTGDAANYVEAEKQASSVIANTSLYSLVTDLNQVFKMNSTEAIWQIMPPSGVLYTPEGNSFILNNVPASSNGKVSISQQLLNAFEPNDQRSVKWVGNYTKNGTTWYYPNKYKDNSTAGSLSEYSMVLRLAEQYLIRAEARAQQGKLTGVGSASEDLNAIRLRAGLLSSTAVTQSALLSAIGHERQVELFTENHRWLDLKRTGKVDSVMTIVTPLKGGSWSSYKQLFPLPVSDPLLDDNIKQNPGY